ncbi:unnamed protein product [Didymodactylos carnosus]|uniref:Vesicle-fusing ATPase n=1 Tax=Didymodactylos carnosus TaxID=1234261 RepID=A0A814GBD9_9BILA|nr:unnamed protein product [Didymodactylos carnosus]CAF3764177.1 unnamed protein product [Didymodactylos carnosus]
MLKKTEQISDTIVTTTTTITTPTIEPRTAQRHGTKLKDIGAFIQSVTGCLAALGPITGTVLCWCGIRCYRNGGECKSAWWYPKTLNEYRRRRDAARGRAGIKYLRGMLIYAPPGTQILIARTICEISGVKPEIVNGPELFSNMLEKSKAKIRELFCEAEIDEQSFGTNSDLHIIIFDEIDALCKRRSIVGTGTRDAIQDSITTQLLINIDGVSQFNNFLIIGTTNIKDSIELALTSPDRLEQMIVHQRPKRVGSSPVVSGSG